MDNKTNEKSNVMEWVFKIAIVILILGTVAAILVTFIVKQKQNNEVINGTVENTVNITVSEGNESLQSSSVEPSKQDGGIAYKNEIIINEEEEAANSEKIEYSFYSQDGEQVYTIQTDDGQYIQAYGWAGASNNVYFIKDKSLFHISLADGAETKVITGVKTIEVPNGDEEKIVAYVTEGYSVEVQDPFIEIKE